MCRLRASAASRTAHKLFIRKPLGRTLQADEVPRNRVVKRLGHGRSSLVGIEKEKRASEGRRVSAHSKKMYVATRAAGWTTSQIVATGCRRAPSHLRRISGTVWEQPPI
jgi:hypothetical protein